MVGLVAYDDSESESEEPVTISPPAPAAAPPKPTVEDKEPVIAPEPAPVPPIAPTTAPAEPEGAILGPTLPPPEGDAPLGPALPSDVPTPSSAPETRPSSPYSAARAAVHMLTLPTTIPPIPRSPSPEPPESLTKSFTKFLELKAQGIHLNSKLSATLAKAQPGLLYLKLLAFAGLDEEEDTLGWTGKGEAGLQEWAYKSKIGTAVTGWDEARQRKIGEPVQFVTRNMERQEFDHPVKETREVASHLKTRDRDYQERDRQRDAERERRDGDRDGYRDRDRGRDRDRDRDGNRYRPGANRGELHRERDDRRGGSGRDDRSYRKRPRSRSLSRERSKYRGGDR